MAESGSTSRTHAASAALHPVPASSLANTGPASATTEADDNAATADLLIGDGKLRRAFLLTPVRVANRGNPLIAGSSEPEIALIHSGFAYRSCAWSSGKEAILDLLIPGDIAGLDRVVLPHPVDQFTAASWVEYHALAASELRHLMTDYQVAIRMSSLLAERAWRSTRLASSIGLLEARERVCLFFLDIHDRLHRRNLIGEPRFNFPFTQDKIANHLGLTQVHFNRVLRRLREENLVLGERSVVTILDLNGLRGLVAGLPQTNDVPEPIFNDEP